MKLRETLIINIVNMTKISFSNLVISIMLFFGMFSLFFPHHAHSTGKIVKWKDEKGSTHYSDSVPAQYATDNSVINQQGITIKRNKPVSKQNEAVDAAKTEQDKKDKALTDSFTNAVEIDLARDRNLQLDLVAVDGLQLQKNNSLKRLAENQNYANSLVKRNKPVPVELSAEIKNDKAEVSKQEQLINERKTTMENTKKRFNDDKIRFIELKNKANGL